LKILPAKYADIDCFFFTDNSYNLPGRRAGRYSNLCRNTAGNWEEKQWSYCLYFHWQFKI